MMLATLLNVAHPNAMTKRDAKTKSFTGINQHPAAMEKYWRALLVLTAESEQTKTMTHLDLDDTKYHEVTNRQAGKRV